MNRWDREVTPAPLHPHPPRLCSQVSVSVQLPWKGPASPLRFLQLSLLFRILDLRNERFEAVFSGRTLFYTGNALKDSNLGSPDIFRLLEARCLKYERDILGTWIGEDVAECSETEIPPWKNKKGREPVMHSNDTKLRSYTHRPIFSCLSFLELCSVLESFKYIPHKCFNPIFSSNCFTVRVVSIR